MIYYVIIHYHLLYYVHVYSGPEENTRTLFLLKTTNAVYHVGTVFSIINILNYVEINVKVPLLRTGREPA